ncbi:MAG: TetR/AcrR family transcriptional regulator [Nocardioides sp.]
MKPYHHGNLRSALIEAGVSLARTQGTEGVVLRQVARETGVSHNAAYRHFADRDELLSEIGSVAAARLAEAMRRRMDLVDEQDPMDAARRRLREVGRAYVEFALAEPGLFEVAFGGDHPPDEAGPEQAGPYHLLGRALDGLVEVGAITPGRRAGADVACWAAVHGFAVLHLTGPLRDLSEEVREATLEVLLTTIERGLTGSAT